MSINKIIKWIIVAIFFVALALVVFTIYYFDKNGLDRTQPQMTSKEQLTPASLEIPTLSIKTTFEYVDLTASGAVGTPQDPSKVGWYGRGSPLGTI